MDYEQRHPVMCPFCRRVIHIHTQNENLDNVVTVKCEIPDDVVWGPGCGRSFRSHNFFKIRTGAIGIEPFNADNPPPSEAEKED